MTKTVQEGKAQMTEGDKEAQQLSRAESVEWRRRLAEADRNNVLCHCRQCDEEWVASGPVACHSCGSLDVEAIACWQFPDG